MNAICFNIGLFIIFILGVIVGFQMDFKDGQKSIKNKMTEHVGHTDDNN
jgi:hypothetical protein